MIDYRSGAEQDAPVIRQMLRQRGVKVEIDRWDWTTGGEAKAGGMIDTIDVTDSITSFSFSKTTRTAMGGGTLSMVSLLLIGDELKHCMDVFDTLDVVRIFEFDKLKFQGYIRRAGTKMLINGSDGSPTRTSTFTITHIGGLLQEAHLGFQILALRINQLDEKLQGFNSRIIAMTDAIANKMKGGGVKISEIINVIIDEWFKLLDAIGATLYKTYLEHYIDFKTGLTAFNETKVLPSSLTFFYDSSNEMSLWPEIQKLTETPFNEIFFDEGERSFWYTGGIGNRLSDQKTYLIGRPTPFDGSYRSGVRHDYFKEMPVKTIPLNWLTQIDLSKSSEESYSVYLAVPLYANFNELSLFCAGQGEIDDNMLAKYLLRPLTMKLFYATMANSDSTSAAATQKSFEDEMKGAVQTLKNWFANNDKFLSGVIEINVPSDPTKDVYVGDKIKLNGINAYWYAEGVVHSWQYGGALKSSITVVRGWDYDNDKAIELNHAIFTGSGFPAGTKQRGGGNA